MIIFRLLTFFVLVFGARVSLAETGEDYAQAESFFQTYDLDGDTYLLDKEFIDGFIDKSQKERPTQTRMAVLLFGKERIVDCLELGFERADQSNDGYLTLEELVNAYAQGAFEDLGKMC